MRYWKGKIGTAKEGQFGTVEDTGSVPDSDFCPKAEYDAWVAARPAAGKTQMQSDIESLSFTSLADAATKMQSILERIRKGER